MVVLGCLCLVVAVGLALAGERRGIENAQALARRLSLQFVGSTQIFTLTSPQREVSGLVGGRRVRIWNYNTGNGRSRVKWLAVSAELRCPSGAHFELRRVSFVTKIAAWTSKGPTYTGDAGFDQEWYLHTTAPHLVRALTPEWRASLMRLTTDSSSRFVRGSEGLCYAEKGSFGSLRSITRIEQHLPLMLELARNLDAAAGPVT